MRITLYKRTYPVKDAPVSVSLAPHDAGQRHTLTVGDTVYDAVCKELRVTVPDGATVDPLRHQLIWRNDKGIVRSTAREVFDLARAGASGFGLAK